MHALSHDALGLARLQPGSFRLVPHVSVLFTFRVSHRLVHLVGTSSESVEMKGRRQWVREK